MKTEKRRPQGLFGMLAADPYRKLAAIAMAVGLWFFLNSQIRRELPLTMRLATVAAQRTNDVLFNRVAVELPTDQVVGRGFFDGDRPIDSVSVVFSGPRYLVDTLENETLDLRITTYLTADWTKSKSIEFTAADVQRNLRSLQELHIEFVPNRVRLDVEKIVGRDQRITPDVIELLVDEQLGPRLRLDTAEFSSETIRILGPASSLAAFPAPGSKPLLARLKSIRDERQLTTTLELAAPPELGLRLAETPSMTIQVKPVTKVFELELPLRVDDLALAPELRGLYRPESDSRKVRIKAAGALRNNLVSLSDQDPKKLRDWALAHLRLEVWISPLEPGATYGPTIVREARLLLRGPLQTSVPPTDFELAETVSVTLTRTQ